MANVTNLVTMGHSSTANYGIVGPVEGHMIFSLWMQAPKSRIIVAWTDVCAGG